MAGQSPEFTTTLAAELGKADHVATNPIVEQIGSLLRDFLAALSRFLGYLDLSSTLLTN